MLDHLGEPSRLTKLVRRPGGTTRLLSLRPLVLQGGADHLPDKGRELPQLERAGRLVVRAASSLQRASIESVRAGRLVAEGLEDLFFVGHLETRVLGQAQQQLHRLVVLDEACAALVGRAEVLDSFLLEELWVLQVQLGGPGMLRSSADEQVVGQVHGLCGGQCPHVGTSLERAPRFTPTPARTQPAG